MGVLAHCRALVANDSGALHLAAAMGVPVVAIYGPTDERYSQPLTSVEGSGRSRPTLSEPVFCRPCWLADCPIDHRCMKRIPPERVLDAVSRFFRKRAPIRSAARAGVGPRLNMTPGCVSRSRRHDDRGRRLSRASRAAEAVSVHDRRHSAAEPRRLQGGRRDEPGRRRATASSPRSFWHEAHEHLSGSAAGCRRDGSTGSTTVRTLPSAAVEKYRTDCECRKPKPGMILAAARDLSLDLARSFVVGDRWRDIEMGQDTRGRRASWSRPATARPRRPSRPAQAWPACPSSANLIEATSWILSVIRDKLGQTPFCPLCDCSNLLDAISIESRGGDRRPDRRRVHLRPRRAPVARGARADPSVRLHADRAGRRRQCRQQRGGARRASATSSASAGQRRGGHAPAVASLARRRHKGIASAGVAISTPVKTRILAGGVHTAKQQIVRIDRVVSTADYDAKTPRRIRPGGAERRRRATRSCCRTTERAS